MTDYRTLTGFDLNVYVAERRGDTVRHASGPLDVAYDFDTETFLSYWIEDADGNAHSVPDVAGDLNAAFAFVQQVAAPVQVWYDAVVGAFEVELTPEDGPDYFHGTVALNDLALHVTRAALAWLDEKAATS